MESLLRAFGWGCVRVLISALAGVGIGLLQAGQALTEKPADLPRYVPPPGLFEGVGYGLLVGGGMLFLLFAVPAAFRTEPTEKRPFPEGLLRAVGGGAVNLLICALVGAGTGLIIVGTQLSNNPDLWRTHDVPAPVLTGTGYGLLAATGMLLLLFVFPWVFNDSPKPPTPAQADRPPTA